MQVWRLAATEWTASPKEGGRRNYKEKESKGAAEEGAMEQSIDKEALLAEKHCNWFTIPDSGLSPIIHFICMWFSLVADQSPPFYPPFSSLSLSSPCPLSQTWCYLFINIGWLLLPLLLLHRKMIDRLEIVKWLLLTNSQDKQRSIIFVCDNQQWLSTVFLKLPVVSTDSFLPIECKSGPGP